MTKSVPEENAEIVGSMIRFTAGIVGAFVQNNSVPALEVPNLIRTVHSTLCGLGVGGGNETRNDAKPAVPVRKSIMPDFIVCLEDGKKLKMLKRYLRSRYSLSPDEYRLKWSLPPNYPMVAPNYAAQRSAFAKRIGLGRSKTPLKQKRRSS